MADDQNQRPYRGNDMPSRVAAPASDPLAELARLIGQNDPFSEYGRDGNRRAAAPQQQEAVPAPAWPPEPPAPAKAAPLYASQSVRQPFGSVPLANAGDVYQGQNAGYPATSPQAAGFPVPDYDVPGYGAPGYEAHGFPAETAPPGYEHEPFPKSQSPFAAQSGGEEDYYDDAPPDRRRMGILAIAGVFALAVIGTAGAFGYRAVFGSSSSSSPPPVIKAEQAPSKIVPATPAKDAQASKMITERVNERGSEKLVSREEQPVPVVTTNAVPAAAPAAGPQGSGVVGSETKKIRTIAIKPDQAGDAAPPQAEPVPAAAPAPAPQPRVISTTPQRQAAAPAPAPVAAPVPLAAPQPQAEPEPAPRAAAPAPRAATPSANAPLSLNPNAPAPSRAAAPAAPQRTAAAAAPAAVSGGGYAVQVSAQRSEEEAQAAFRSLQGKYPSQLGGRQPFIKRVDLGEKGIYFRAMVGPFGSQGAAAELCTSLKSAGGSCLVQKN